MNSAENSEDSTVAISLTNPARELVEFCQWIESIPSKENTTAAHIGKALRIKPWSVEFYRFAIFINGRFDRVLELVESLSIDKDIIEESKDQLEVLRSPFTEPGFRSPWNPTGGNLNNNSKAKLSQLNRAPIKALSSEIQRLVAYPKLDSETRQSIDSECAELQAWLEDHQLSEFDFIRQMIIDGIKSFREDLQREHFGTEYILNSLRELIEAYMLLERTPQFFGSGLVNQPDYGAMLKKVGSTLKFTYSKINFVKSTLETGDFVLKAYGALHLAKQMGIAGLLAQN